MSVGIQAIINGFVVIYNKWIKLFLRWELIGLARGTFAGYAGCSHTAPFPTDFAFDICNTGAVDSTAIVYAIKNMF